MPIVETIPVKNGQILHWDTSETLDELKLICAKSELDITVPDYHEGRQKQILVMRLLHNIASPGTTLHYTQAGKPYLNSELHISFSHHDRHVVVLVSEKECGVDLELIHERIRKVTGKYLSDHELKQHHNSDTENLIRMWTAKEAMYKVYGKDTVFLRSNIFVNIRTETKADAELQDNGLIIRRQILFRKISDMILAWTEADEE